MIGSKVSIRGVVNCRIGSLENETVLEVSLVPVNCRIGSLEMLFGFSLRAGGVNCRIGSLEI